MSARGTAYGQGYPVFGGIRVMLEPGIHLLRGTPGFVKGLKEAGILMSMGSAEDALDNAVAREFLLDVAELPDTDLWESKEKLQTASWRLVHEYSSASKQDQAQGCCPNDQIPHLLT